MTKADQRAMKLSLGAIVSLLKLENIPASSMTVQTLVSLSKDVIKVVIGP